ncbi:CHY zinc finger protein [Corynebacterium sp. zg331]|uniref:CHY zinc finger protein n=1 Tax=unclassified Corynebacterium TaxID=2624378 RepID=UPI00351B0651
MPVHPLFPGGGRPGVIRGRGVDAQGRCAHYRQSWDVVANLCATCGAWWACHRCHAEAADHPFGRVRREEAGTVLCGACGHHMGYAQYHGAAGCPQCGHPFNPGCGAHAGLYFC